MKPLNILFLLTDQQRFDTLGLLNPHIKTPNLDRLARSGITFTRAFAPSPVCLPCRASLMAGQYPSTHGATHNHAQLSQSHLPTMATPFRRAGYHTHIIGKSHLAPCHDPTSFESAPHIHNRGFFRNWRGPWYDFERADINIGHSTEKHACGMHYGVWLEERGIDTSKYFGHTRYDQYGPWDLPLEHHNSAWIAETVIKSIDDAQHRNRPFLLWANFQDPHNPCMVPEPYASMYDPNAIPTFGFKPGEPDCFKDKPPFYRDLLAQPGEYACKPTDPLMTSAGNVSHLPFTAQQTQQNAACYYGMVSLIDYHVGRILDHLERLGLRENTLVVFASDHGDLLGDHGLWWKSLVCYDESIRVPLIASLPGRLAQNQISRAFQSLVDLPTTFCDLAGVERPHQFEGVVQTPAWCDAAKSVRNDVIVEERPFNTAWAQRILINDTHKLAFYANCPYGELYDVNADPHHIHNLWSRAEHQSLKFDMLTRIASHDAGKRRPNPPTPMVAT